MDRYLIESQNTKYFVTNRDEEPGHVVVTADGKDSIPHDAVLTIRPPLHPGPNVVSIQGSRGLFIALPDDPEDDAKLVWSERPYQWVITQTSSGPYEIRPASGQDLYWFDKFGIGPVIIVKPGRDVQPPQGYFKLLPILRD